MREKMIEDFFTYLCIIQEATFCFTYHLMCITSHEYTIICMCSVYPATWRKYFKATKIWSFEYFLNGALFFLYKQGYKTGLLFFKINSSQ